MKLPNSYKSYGKRNIGKENKTPKKIIQGWIEYLNNQARSSSNIRQSSSGQAQIPQSTTCRVFLCIKNCNFGAKEIPSS